MNCALRQDDAAYVLAVSSPVSCQVQQGVRSDPARQRDGVLMVVRNARLGKQCAFVSPKGCDTASHTEHEGQDQPQTTL